MREFKFKNAGVTYAYTSAELRANAYAVAVNAVANTYAVTNGGAWYDLARAELISLAVKFGYTLRQLAASAAVLSSMMPWERNIPAMVEILQAYNSGARGTDLPAVTRNFECVRKVERILNGETPEHVVVKRGKRVAGQSFKTLNFFYNLMGAANMVTVDVWMWRMFTADPKTQYRPDGYLYVECANIIRELAAEFNFKPAQLQAIMWMLYVEKPAMAEGN